MTLRIAERATAAAVSMLSIPVAITIAGTTALTGTGVASADPSTDQGTCNFTLSTPQRVAVSGVDMVTATVTPYPCTGSAYPNIASACLTLVGGDIAPMCIRQMPSPQVQVFLSPYRPGASYVATGTACTGLPAAPFSTCAPLGPKTAKL